MSDVALSMPQEHRAAVIQLGAELFQGLKVIDAGIDAFVRAPGQRQAMHEDVYLIKLWIGGADGAAGFADLARLVSQLKAATSTEARQASSEVQLGHALVYSWNQGSSEPKSHL